MTAIDDRRIGRFSIALQLINDQPALVRQVLASVIVLRAETIAHLDEIEYVGVSDAFEPLAEGGLVPGYKAVCHHLFNQPPSFVRWDREYFTFGPREVVAARTNA